MSVATEGNWAVQQCFGSSPVSCGQVFEQQYHSGSQYFEIDVDLGTGDKAAGAVRMVRENSAKIASEIAFILEGIVAIIFTQLGKFYIPYNFFR